MYNPGVTDRSGEILAGGINSTIARYAQDMETLRANEQKRRLAAGQVAGLLASDPQLAQQADPALVQKMSAGKANLNDTLQLLGTLTTMRGARDDQTRMQLEQMKAQQVQAQTQSLLAELAARRQNEQAQRAAAPLLTNETPADYAARGGMVMRNPEPPRQGDPTAALANYIKQGGNDPTMVQYLSSLAATKTKAEAKPSGMVFRSVADLQQQYPSDKYEYDMKVDGKSGQVSVDKISGRAPAPAQPNTFVSTLDAGIAKQVDATISAVPAHQATIESVQRAKQAIAAGSTQGGGAAAKLALYQGINAVFPGAIDTKETEIAQNSYASMALTAAERMKGQGQITEQERKLLADTVAKLGNSPQAAVYIMDYMDAAARRNLGKAEAIQALRDAGEEKSVKYSRLLSTWEKDNPIELPPPAAPKAGATPTINFPGDKTAPTAAKGSRFKIVEIR